MKSFKLLLLIVSMTTSTGTVFAQRLSDSMFNNMSRVEMGDHFNKKGKLRKAGGYALLGIGAALSITASALIIDDLWSSSNDSEGATVLALAGLISMGASYPVLTSGSKAKGRAELLYMNPDPEKAAALTKVYRRKVNTNAIIAWSLVGAGFAVPIILQSTTNDDDEMSSTAQTVSNVAILGIFGSIPFFMVAAKNKGRLSILARTENLPTSYIQGSGTHRSIGIGFPIGN